MKDITGIRFGKLVAKKYLGIKLVGKKRVHKRHLWLCQCDCGNETQTLANALTSGNTRSCGCLLKETQQRKLFNDLTGMKFKRLTVVKMQKRIFKNILWECKCGCGNAHVVRGSNLLSGATQSCGCLFLQRVTKHGMCKKGEPISHYMREIRKNPEKNLRHRISCNIRSSLKRRGSRKIGGTFDHLPYTPRELKEHLENLWESWMNWNNYGSRLNNKQKTWHIDHIIPHSHFQYNSMEDDAFTKCWALENLRPLEKHENRKKGSSNSFRP